MESISLSKFNGHKIACLFTDSGSKDIVIFCHGYRGAMIGPNRFFVELTRKLAQEGISSLRFDQFGSGNSEGDFLDSSFRDWVATTTAIAQDYLSKGYSVSLMGQSMGGSTVIDVGSELSDIATVVAWVPDPNVEEFVPSPTGVIEEGGQLVKNAYWEEAHATGTAAKLSRVKCPMYIVQCSDDEFVSPENHKAISDNAQPGHEVEMFKGYKHSSWTRQQADTIMGKTLKFLIKNIKKRQA